MLFAHIAYMMILFKCIHHSYNSVSNVIQVHNFELILINKLECLRISVLRL